MESYPQTFTIDIPEGLNDVLELRFMLLKVMHNASMNLDNEVIRDVLMQ